MSRLAFLTPLPPDPSGIADYSADVLSLLAHRHQIDVFHDQDQVDRQRVPGSCAVHRARDFRSRHRERPYDLAIYQMGNGLAHAFLYDLLAVVPGLLVLHELVLHHSRGRMFLESEEVRAYKSDPSSAALRESALCAVRTYQDEVDYSYPDQAGRLAEAQLGTVGDLLPYAYPLFRIPVEASRLTAVHNRFMAEAIREEVPAAETVHIAMPIERVPVAHEAVESVRARYGIQPDDFVVASFGLLTREKRIETVARAVARVAAALPRVRLLLVGAVPDRAGLDAMLERLGVRERTVVAGRVPFVDLPTYIEAADLAVHLRYPTARETSAALLRVLAQGRPTVVSDLEHLADVPDHAVIRADVLDEEGEVTRAILRLVDKPELRRRLGDDAAAFVEREHSPERCLESYDAAIERALRTPTPPVCGWPAHWARS